MGSDVLPLGFAEEDSCDVCFCLFDFSVEEQETKVSLTISCSLDSGMTIPGSVSLSFSGLSNTRTTFVETGGLPSSAAPPLESVA